MPGFRVPTFHSALDAQRRTKGKAEPTPNRPVRCPCCGCPRIPLDMLFDLRALPAELRAALRLRNPNADFACDGCMATVYREGHTSHGELHAAWGAPDDVLATVAECDRQFPYPIDTRAHRYAQGATAPARSRTRRR